VSRYSTGRRDEGEPAIVARLEELGLLVIKLDRNDPCDLLVGGNRRWWCVEVKSPFGPAGGGSTHGQRLSKVEAAFAAKCGVQRLPYIIVRSIEDADDLHQRIAVGEGT